MAHSNITFVATRYALVTIEVIFGKKLIILTLYNNEMGGVGDAVTTRWP